jgi:chemotaxis protein CheD
MTPRHGHRTAERPGDEALARLRAHPRQPDEASLFFHDNQFDRPAVKVLPGEYFVHDGPIVILTTLGSCIATCLWDPQRRIGGMNHFMLPEGNAAGASAGRYGSYAMELLINALMKRGAARARLHAKVFGGGMVVEGTNSINIGKQNTRFVLDYLATEGVPVLAHDVLDIHPRKVRLMPDTGEVKVKRLPPTRAGELARREQEAAHHIAPPRRPRAAWTCSERHAGARWDPSWSRRRWWWSTTRRWCAACLRRSSTAAATWNASAWPATR